MNNVELEINQRQYWELKNLANGAFLPLKGFMCKEEFLSVVEHMRLPNQEVFPLPVVLDLSSNQARSVLKSGNDKIALKYNGNKVGTIVANDVFRCDKSAVVNKIFSTSDINHPGVRHFLEMGEWFMGGQVSISIHDEICPSVYDLSPSYVRDYFEGHGWKTVVGFQTRNVPHRAHEYLLRFGLEMADGLFIQPLVGRKKNGDFTPEAILTAYRALIDGFMPRDRILLGTLTTSMRYAGPREAIFHAIIRRNFGCTHFIVGRDHAGVGDYYGKYEAHDLARRFENELEIEILKLSGPFSCEICDGIVTENSCPHLLDSPDATTQISGTDMRSILVEGQTCPPKLMRPEIVESIQGTQIFIEDAE